MSLLPKDQVVTLAERSKDLCVSIFMPTQHAGPPVRQNLIRFKNLLQEAEERLVESGIRAQDARELLEPAQELDNEDFWRHQSDGIALFLAPGLFRYYRLPLSFEELVVVTDRFHLKPLLPLFSGDEQFYVLALSQHGVRLLQGTRYRVGEIDLQNVPKNVSEALRYDDSTTTQFRTSTSGGGAANSMPQAGVFHGQGNPEDTDANVAILEYFHQVNDGVYKLLGDKQAPLILMGVEHLLPLYREANTYPHLVEEGLTGNPELLKPEELHDQAWTIVEPYSLKAQQEAADRYHELVGTGQASNDLQEIVPAAIYGRVDSLFVATGVEKWGIFDPGTNTLQLHQTEEPGDEDLLDLAAVKTFLNSGNVYAVEPDKVPDGGPIAAVFRY